MTESMISFRRVSFFFSAIICSFFPSVVSAHVGYLLSANEMHSHAGSDMHFLMQPLRDSFLVFLMLASIATVIVLLLLERRFHLLRRLDQQIDRRTKTYPELFGWILRLSLGIALLGAGTSGVLLSPGISTSPSLAFLETLLGFFLLIGFLVGPAAIIATLLSVYTLTLGSYSLSHLDILAIALSICLLCDARPGVDDILSIPQMAFFTRWRNLVPSLLARGVGISMVYLAVYEKFLNPHMSALVVDRFSLPSVIPVSTPMWVLSAGLIEFVVGALLIFRVKPRLISAIAFLVLSLSFFYFKEGVSSHITLFGSLSLIFCYGERKSLS